MKLYVSCRDKCDKNSCEFPKLALELRALAGPEQEKLLFYTLDSAKIKKS